MDHKTALKNKGLGGVMERDANAQMNHTQDFELSSALGRGSGSLNEVSAG